MSSPRKRAPAVRPRNAPQARPGPAGGTRDANRKARTQAIAKAALELFLDRGVEAVSVDDVVRRARIAKGSFYTYFRDQSELVEALIPVFARSPNWDPREQTFPPVPAGPYLARVTVDPNGCQRLAYRMIIQ